ncbi:MAG: OsmC family peroxiredoxin [Bacteroidetes bacterium]|nr:MAG: OsmC family peroxiredoxin [Bacteroidota bacterium]
MFQIKNTYLGDLRTEAVHLSSQNKIITDAPLDNNGKGEAFSPTDLVCAALASCKMTIMGIVARRENLDLSSMTCEVQKIMTSQAPRKIHEIVVTFAMPNIELTEKQREMLKNAALTCPVALSLDPQIKRTVNFNF